MNKTDDIKLGSHMDEKAYLELKETKEVKDRFHNPFFNGFAIEEELAHYFAFKYGFDEKLVRVVKNVTVYEPLCNGSYKKHYYNREPVYIDEEHNYARFDTFSFLGNKHWKYVNGQLFFYKDERDSKENGK